MIGALLGGLFGKVKMWLAAAAAGAVIVLAARAKWRKEGRDVERLETLEDTNRRVAEGAKGAEQARAAQDQGRSPEDGVRNRDGRWR